MSDDGPPPGWIWIDEEVTPEMEENWEKVLTQRELDARRFRALAEHEAKWDRWDLGGKHKYVTRWFSDNTYLALGHDSLPALADALIERFGDE